MRQQWLQRRRHRRSKTTAVAVVTAAVAVTWAAMRSATPIHSIPRKLHAAAPQLAAAAASIPQPGSRVEFCHGRCVCRSI